jgi:hypothetical protein
MFLVKAGRPGIWEFDLWRSNESASTAAGALNVSLEKIHNDNSTYCDVKKVLRSGKVPVEKLGRSFNASGNEPGLDNESSTSSMLFSDGDIASMTFSGGICHGKRLLRSVDAIEHSSSIGSEECLSLSRHDKAVS